MQFHAGFNCTVPYFGFKAKQKLHHFLKKTIVLCLILDSRQNKVGAMKYDRINCTVPYFGFKAKLKSSTL